MNTNQTLFPFTPKPKDTDYQAEYIFRYFARPASHRTGEITEISKNDFNSISKNPLYKTVKLEWKISGPDFSVLDISKKFEVIKPISSVNKDSIKLAEKILPGLSGKLTNLLQFWSGY